MDEFDTLYEHPERNKNPRNGNTLAGWLPITFSNHQIQPFKYDTTLVGTPDAGDYAFQFSSQFSGTEQLGVQQKTLTMNEATLTFDFSRTQNSQVLQHSYETFIMNYSSSSGVFGGQTDVSNQVDGASGELTRRTLISYSVK